MEKTLISAYNASLVDTISLTDNVNLHVLLATIFFPQLEYHYVQQESAVLPHRFIQMFLVRSVYMFSEASTNRLQQPQSDL
jgi:hypothetical protein